MISSNRSLLNFKIDLQGIVQSVNMLCPHRVKTRQWEMRLREDTDASLVRHTHTKEAEKEK